MKIVEGFDLTLFDKLIEVKNGLEWLLSFHTQFSVVYITLIHISFHTVSSCLHYNYCYTVTSHICVVFS